MPLKGSFNSENKPTKKETKPVQTQTKSEQEDPCANIKHDINKFGVTYSKLDEKNKMYGEDNTQDCCLSPEQMDANFNFLHGDDVKSGRFDPKKMMLVLDRYFTENKDMAKSYLASIKISTENILSGTTFDPDTGILHLVFNGKEIDIPGFGSGGGGVDPEKVVRIIRDELRGEEGIKIEVKKPTGEEEEKTVISIDYFDGGEIDIENNI